MTTWLKRYWFWLAVNIGAALPLLLLAWDLWQGNLSANPIDDITDRTGNAALILLILSLTCTPAHFITGWRKPPQVRKALGMFAFVYASIHLLNFVGADYGFDTELILADGLPSKPYILAGLLSFLIMVPLAITTATWWKKRLGPKWKKLHRSAYVAGAAAVVHFFWLAKAAEKWEPLVYAVLLSALLIVRLPPLRRRIVDWRLHLTGAPPASARHPAPLPARRTTHAD